MVKLNSLASDRKAENEGEWHDVPELGFKDDGKPVRIQTRSLNYPPYKMDLMQTRLRLQRKYPGDKMVPPDIEDGENGRIYATHLLMNWDGIDPGYSAEVALEALRDPAQRLLRETVVSCARITGQMRNEQTEEISGN